MKMENKLFIHSFIHSVWGEHMSCVCVGIFHESGGRVKYPYTKTTNVFSNPD